MNTRFLRTAVGVAALATTVIAQAPTFRMDPAVRLGPAGGTLAFDLTAVQGTVYATLGNLDGGPTDLLGERFYLGFSPTLVTLDAGVMPAGGVAAGQILIPAFAGALGLAVFGQCAVLDASAPNGLVGTMFRSTCQVLCWAPA